MDLPELSPAEAVRICKEQDVPMGQVTLSSDGNGSMAEYDAQGRVVRLLVFQASRK